MTSRGQWSGFKSILGSDMKTYLMHKRSLGCQFDQEESGLRLFDRFLVERRMRRRAQIKQGVLEAFLCSRPRPRPRSYNQLLGSIGRFLRWLVAHERLPIMPSMPAPKRRTGTRLPFIFDGATAKRLLDSTAALRDSPTAPLRGLTYRTIFAILYGLGLRVGEVCRLCHHDIDLDRAVLVIRESKFGKTRLVPFGPRVAATLSYFLRRKFRKLRPSLPDMPVFTFDGSKPINRHSINRVFRHLVDTLELPMAAGMQFPRTHDLRHSFAVGTLLRWYRCGIDPNTRLLHLSTFLGHVDISSTAVYLTMTPELLREANHRFERFARPAVDCSP